MVGACSIPGTRVCTGVSVMWVTLLAPSTPSTTMALFWQLLALPERETTTMTFSVALYCGQSNWRVNDHRRFVAVFFPKWRFVHFSTLAVVRSVSSSSLVSQSSGTACIPTGTTRSPTTFWNQRGRVVGLGHLGARVVPTNSGRILRRKKFYLERPIR
jgi:hypothetical protein